uniref:NitT/TauT family transport system ATP-binding protein n=1 Tax=Candidatus Kentrum sp. TUN TaxID=2126343 RepID=A0A450ZGN9_9GAMM|nr:MAG: NitT/TauT family transport system ATP-binding protein [Candidatus Kentron sp. TUN]VFK53519.1 MAG: NitT/TauT family transport system ATP-binding protein [Candidatus Kentron sp. TUN]
MAILELQNVSFLYSNLTIVQEQDLSFESGEIVSIMGPSGCGKSTVLRLLAGLEKPSSGKYFFNGELLERPSTELRFSFQDFDAFPWKTVNENLLFSGATTDSGESTFNINELIGKIGLNNHEHKFPSELSGGMRKRLALGRCLAGKPKVILLDEPFSSLDVDARQEMYNLLQLLWMEWNCLFVIVTHDIHEAIILSQRIILSKALPFRKKNEIKVPFKYPRDNSVIDTPEYRSLIYETRTSQ